MENTPKPTFNHTRAGFATVADRLAFVRYKLGTDHRWAIRALGVIANNQTADEYDACMTTNDNGVGFTALDAQLMTSFHRQVVKAGDWQAGNKLPLSPKQMAILFKRMPKYAAQLLATVPALRLKYPTVNECQPGPMRAGFEDYR